MRSVYFAILYLFLSSSSFAFTGIGGATCVEGTLKTERSSDDTERWTYKCLCKTWTKIHYEQWSASTSFCYNNKKLYQVSLDKEAHGTGSSCVILTTGGNDDEFRYWTVETVGPGGCDGVDEGEDGVQPVRSCRTTSTSKNYFKYNDIEGDLYTRISTTATELRYTYCIEDNPESGARSVQVIGSDPIDDRECEGDCLPVIN